MKKRILLLITFLTIAGCGLFDSESGLKKYNPNIYPSLTKSAPFELKITTEKVSLGNLRLEVQITNKTSDKIGLSMDGVNNYLFREFFVTTLDTNIVWRSYNSDVYALKESSVVLEPNATIVLDEDWELIDNGGNEIGSGNYLLFGGLSGVYQEEITELEDTTVVGGERLEFFGNVGVGRNSIIISLD